MLTVLTSQSPIAFADVGGTSYGSNWNYYYNSDDEPDCRKAAYWCEYYCENFDSNYSIYKTYETKASSIYSWAECCDAIEFLASHAGPGRIWLAEDLNNDDNWDKTYLRAGIGGESNTDNYYYLSTYNSTDIDSVALWIFAGCNTADTSDTLGNLVNMATIKGVDCVIGYSDYLYWPTTNTTYAGNRFYQEFWYYSAGMAETISESHDIALDNLIALEGSTRGFDTVEIQGYFGGSYFIKPAHYGF